MIKQYLAMGADVNEDLEILYEAARQSDGSILKLLLDSGATKKTVQEAYKFANKRTSNKEVLKLLKDAERGKK